MKIIHFSDPHAGGPAEDWMAYLDKRWVGVFNYRFRRRFRHDQQLLKLAVNYILDVSPDVAVCTGDLTSTGQPGEFAQAMQILKPLYESKIPLLFVPGNHDCYVYRSKCVNAMKQVFETMNQGRLHFDELPAVVDIADVRFLMVNESWPSNLISSCGYLKKKSQDFIAAECLRDMHIPKILIGHYPLLENHPWLRIRHRLWGQNSTVRLLEQKNLSVSLSGHVHKPSCQVDETGRGEYCAGSVTRNGTISMIEYVKESDLFVWNSIKLK
jgi:3',5'-cyclic AMP phosphodiesterase CpdA